jgi:hypothetical protein
MRNSAMALGGSAPIWATPPKIKSVMLRTGILYRSATRECPNSWSSTLTKSMMAVSTPMNQYSSDGQFLNSTG